MAKYGLRQILAATVALGALAAAAVLVFWPAAALPAAVWLGVLWFFRDPERSAEAPAGLLAPADGTVVEIAALPADGPLGRAGTRVSIFMSLLDVHVNRSPAECTVRRIEHKGGGFVDARQPEASERNESASVHLEIAGADGPLPVIVRQIAGLVARRIVTDVRPDQPLARGERIGMIKFGSRVELLVPDELVGEVAVAVGRKVRGGRTILIRRPENPETR